MDVRMPDGVIVRNVPDGISKEELLFRYNKRKFGGGEAGPTARPLIPGAGAAQAAVQAQEIEQEIPAFQRFEQNASQYAPLLLGGAAGVATGGASLPVSALLSGAVGGAGELARQRVAGEKLDPMAAVEEGAYQAGGGLAAGGILKGLGWIGRKIFHTPLGPEAARAAGFAREEGLPFPLFSAAPGSGAAGAQGASQAMLPGHLRTVSDANRVTQFLNQRVGMFTEKANVFDDAAARGQKFLREVFDPGEKAMRETLAEFRTAVGPDALIEINATKPTLRTVYERLNARGDTRSPLYRRVKAMINPKGPGFNKPGFSPQEMDDLLRGVIQDTFVKGTTWADEGKMIIDAIVKDMDGYGRNLGLTFADDYAKAAAGRAEYRELRDIPGLAQLSREMGSGGAKRGSIDWMNSLFREENAKALAKIRELNPSLYHDLADAWLARQIQQFTRTQGDTILNALDGPALRTWVEQNGPKLKQFMTKEQFKALDNFSLYAKYMIGAQEKSAKGMGEMGWVVGRAGAEAAGMVKKPFLFIPTQASAFLLARGLSDPSSSLFRAFTEGFSPQFRSFVVKSGQLGGQAAGDAAQE